MTARQRNHATSLWPSGGQPTLVPDTSLEETAWQELARCAEVDPEIFFPERGGTAREAKKVCRRCEVRAACLEWAIQTDQRFGVAGGMSERERRKLHRNTDQEVAA